MESSAISVIVPVYKAEKYLERCIKSLLRQTYENMEIILVDDGSPDSCPQLCDEWAAMKINNDFFLINSIIRNNRCRNRYQMLRKDIIKRRKYILGKKAAGFFSARHKIGVILLMLAPKLYDKTILMRRGIRGY